MLKLAPDLFRIDGLSFICERRVAGDHEAVGQARQVSREIVCDPIGEIVVVGIAAKIVEGQHNDRQPPCARNLVAGGPAYPVRREPSLPNANASRDKYNHERGDEGRQAREYWDPGDLDRVGESFADLGEQKLKNIARPMRAYLLPAERFAGKREPTRIGQESLLLALPDKPSIAVLPFANLSGDPEQDYFADGLVEELTDALSRARWFFVIARNSSFTFKGRAVDVRQVGRELGVRYVLGRQRPQGRRARAHRGAIGRNRGRAPMVWGRSIRWRGRRHLRPAGHHHRQRGRLPSSRACRRSEIERARAGSGRKASTPYPTPFLRALPHMHGVAIGRGGRGSPFGCLEQALRLEPDYADRAWACSPGAANGASPARRVGRGGQDGGPLYARKAIARSLSK